MRVSSTFLTSVAGGLRGLGATLIGVEQLVGDLLASGATSVDAVEPHWGGPRADSVLGAARHYLALTGGASVTISTATFIADVRGVIGRWATVADELAAELSGHENTLSRLVETPGDQVDHDSAFNAITEINSIWVSSSTSFAAEIDTYRAPMSASAERQTFGAAFPYPPRSGAAYEAAVNRFSLTSAIPLDIIDPSGQTAAAGRSRLDSLFTTDTGRLVFTIIETAHEENINESDEHWSIDDLLAASDPATVARHIRAIYGEAGEPLDRATLDTLVDETVAAAWSIRASGSDDWRDRDEDLGFFEHGLGEWLREDFAGPATAFVVTAGCIGVVTAGSGGTASLPAAGACAALGGAAGDGVGTWANGGDLGDVTAAVVNPQRRVFDFAIGAGTQGLLNRVLPTAPAVRAPVAPPSGGIGPVLQGQAGVLRTADDLVAAGGRVFGEEVTIVTASGSRTRLDLFVELPNGQRAFLEVKTGVGAVPNPNQLSAFPEIITGGGTPVGANATRAGLDAGVEIGPTQVWVVHQPWPLPPP